MTAYQQHPQQHPQEHPQEHPQLDPKRCALARISRDSRFDGEFFIAVKTTGIYCRPVCPARPPAEKNVCYFRHAAQAADAGYRPCLRCRPESAPNSPAWRGSSTTVQRALDLINAGALNEANLDRLAQRLGVGERYLRKLFEREVGVSPLSVAQNQRLLFAKKLLVETGIPITEVAFAAGYSSVRRFNSAVRNSFKTTPSGLRKKRSSHSPGGKISLQLQYRPPYDWEGVMDFFARHAIEGVEQVTPQGYERNDLINGQPSRLRVSHLAKKNSLQLDLWLPDLTALMPSVAKIRQMFDLDANPQVIAAALSQNKVLGELVERYPGLRTPTHGSVFESMVRAVVGQQVSIQAARKVSARLAAACAQDNRRGSQALVFPAPEEISRLSDQQLPMPNRRKATLRAVSELASMSGEQPDLDALSALKGIGPWSTGMVAMRGYADPDIFPIGDLGLVKAYAALAGEQSINEEVINRWSPWRSYAANLLWRSLSQ